MYKEAEHLPSFRIFCSHSLHIFIFFSYIYLLFTKCAAYSLFSWSDTILRSITSNGPAERFNYLSVLFSKGLEYTVKCEAFIANSNPYCPSREAKLERLQLPAQGSALVCQRLVHFAFYRHLLLTRFLCHYSTFARNRCDGRPNGQYQLSLNKGRPVQNPAYSCSYRHLLLTRFLCHHSSFPKNRRDGRPNGAIFAIFEQRQARAKPCLPTPKLVYVLHMYICCPVQNTDVKSRVYRPPGHSASARLPFRQIMWLSSKGLT